uniref:Uncharacterized protein n=1 Tax=Arundo donax TaxID=35708 RepID=A0A0A9DBD0_ARUDO
MNPATADEVIMAECVAVPNVNIQLTEPFNEGYMKLLIERGVSSPI